VGRQLLYCWLGQTIAGSAAPSPVSAARRRGGPPASAPARHESRRSRTWWRTRARRRRCAARRTHCLTPPPTVPGASGCCSLLRPGRRRRRGRVESQAGRPRPGPVDPDHNFQFGWWLVTVRARPVGPDSCGPETAIGNREKEILSMSGPGPTVPLAMQCPNHREQAPDITVIADQWTRRINDCFAFLAKLWLTQSESVTPASRLLSRRPGIRVAGLELRLDITRSGPPGSGSPLSLVSESWKGRISIASSVSRLREFDSCLRVTALESLASSESEAAGESGCLSQGQKTFSRVIR
jgi:hypothetical protein